jgi:glycosyltransferase involved in cell wall biosynthesis
MPEKDVTLVIPARNAASTVERCLGSVTPLLERPRLKEIILVDDGSTDETAERVRPFCVRYIRGSGAGRGAARNLGWRAADTRFIWFVDSDCVAEPDALDILLEHVEDEGVAGVGGSYGNMVPESTLASLIHEEIVERHLGMPREVDFLATFNTLYRRDYLEAVGGFSEHLSRAQDADLAFRIRRQGGRLEFDARSIVKHYHSQKLWSYLGVQKDQGFWRMWLYLEHSDKMGGDSYSGILDHLQPPLAMLSLACLPFGPLAAVALPASLALAMAQVPMTWRLVRRTGDPRQLWFVPMGFLRSYARGLGMSRGALSVLGNRFREGLRKR